ncbi:ESX secretion-associated protein EspG [Allokutzneria albata]|uniref:EspG family protein n=1 Tax=Allokutzneria albata TaxID=211114 RepID=A0A1H0CQM0_ALLAB|nr:ESX secretion-associated protein EspG [Allokutzneria albata]SDN60217.1 EspG family protein [Allokutzneria albata]
MSGTGGNSRRRYEKSDWRGGPYREDRPAEWFASEPWRRDDIAAQEQRLRGAVRMGEDRAMTQTGHWEGVPHQKMWDEIHDRNKPGDVFLDADRWTKLGNEMAERSGAMARAIEETANGWVGRGGDAARAGSLKLAEWAGDAAISLQYMGNRTADLGDRAEWAKHAMPKPAERTTIEATFLDKAAGLLALVSLGELKLKLEQAKADLLHQEAARVMQVNENGTREVDAGEPVKALAAARGEHAVLAVLAGESLRLATMPARELARAAVSVLPPGPAGRGQPVTVAVEVLRAATSPERGPLADEAAVLSANGMSATQVRTVQRLAATRWRAGQFSVTIGGRQHPVVLAWFDADDGRYLQVSENGSLSIMATDAARIANRLGELL